jgi:hypothetical protein
LCGEAVYRKGGEPVYLRPFSKAHPGRCDSRFILTGQLRGDRFDRPLAYAPLAIADPQGDPHLPLSVGCVEPAILQESMLLGVLFRADELEKARALHEEPNVAEAAAIEVLDGSTVDCDPVDLQVTLFVQTLDRLFRRRKVSVEIGRQPLLEPIVEQFRRLANIEPAIPKTAGANAIISLLQLRADAQWSSNSSLQYVFDVAGMALGEIKSNCAQRGVELAEQLHDDDIVALDNLARGL